MNCSICGQALIAQCANCKTAIPLLRRGPDWVDVKKRLPETSDRGASLLYKTSDLLLLYTEKYGVVIGFLEEVDEDSYDWIAVGIQDNYLITDVTHWMPLPEPPNEAL